MERRLPRVPTTHALLIRTLSAQPSERFAKTQDVSQGGCLFVTESRFGVGAALHLLLAAQGQVIMASAQVVHETPRADGMVKVGAAFLGMSPADRQLLECFVSARRLFPPQAEAVDPAASGDGEDREVRAPRSYLALMGREIRPALMAVSKLSRQVLKSPVFPEEAERLRLIHDVARYLLGLAYQVRRIDRPSASELPWSSEVFDPRTVLRSALTLIRPKARGKSVWFQETVGESVPQLLQGNGLQFYELVAEVLSTAVRCPAAPRQLAALVGTPTGLLFRVSAAAPEETGTGLSSQASPQKTVISRRLSALAGAMGARIELDCSSSGTSSIAVHVPASPAPVPPSERAAGRDGIKPNRKLLVLPSMRGGGLSGSRYDRAAAQRVSRLLRRRHPSDPHGVDAPTEP